MKSLYFSISILLFLSGFYKSYSQCQLVVPTHVYNVCQGSPVQLHSFINCEQILGAANFNTDTLDAGWSSNSGPMFTNPCGANVDGTTYLWIGPATSFPREIISPSFNIINSVTICFDMKYASQANSTPCEGPDMNTEGVHFQYSNTGVSGPWTDIGYWDPLGGYDPILTVWNNYCQTLNTNGNTWFRWYQDVTSGNDFDHWGLDNIIISSQVNPSASDSIYWSNSNGIFHNGFTPPLFIPDSSMWVTVTHYNGTNISTDSIRINVFQNSSISFTGLTDTICNNNSTISLSGNPSGGYFTGTGISDTIFNPLLANIGWNNIQYNYALTHTDTTFGTATVFNDDFSTDKGWAGYGQGGWERDTATASTGCSGSQDPSLDHSPSNDNYIIGNYIGGCYPASMTQTYWLTSPLIDCSNYNSCRIEFYSFSGCESPSFDHMYIDASSDGGGTWTNVYYNTASVAESAWTIRTYATPTANNSSTFKIRIGMGVTDGSVQYSGWNIDDFSVICTGQSVTTDTLCISRYIDSVFVNNCTGIQNNSSEQNHINLIPNPATGGTVNAEWLFQKEDTYSTLEIYNNNGQIVYKTSIAEIKGNKEISLDNLSNGVYEVRLLNSKGTIVRSKLIINKY